MTGRERYRLGPDDDYTGIPAQPERPASETTRNTALRVLRQALAHTGHPCHCGHGSHTHRHRDPGAAHCGVCQCTAYRKAST